VSDLHTRLGSQVSRSSSFAGFPIVGVAEPIVSYCTSDRDLIRVQALHIF
jgi:hypothetical protein